MSKTVLYVGVALLSAAMLSAQGNSPDTIPNGKGNRPSFLPPPGDGKPSGGSRSSSNGINYHGGPVLTQGTNVYYIWYGSWFTGTTSNNTATTILKILAQNIGPSPYFNINTTYYQLVGTTKTAVQNAVFFTGQTAMGYPYGTKLGDSQIAQIVQDAINGRNLTSGWSGLPADANGVYFVLTSSDVQETSGFCKNYCGWHTYSSTIVSGMAIKYAFIGNPDQCPSACEAQTSSPNNNAGADGMASIIAHELEESTTDPQLNAWYDVRGEENADKCAWTFGTTFPSTNGGGGVYNMLLGGKEFLIQRNWVNANGGFCALQY